MTFAEDLTRWYPKQVGKLVTHLHAFEYALRGRLSYEDPPVDGVAAADVRLADLEVGQAVPVNALSSYESLGQLIRRYNQLISAEDPDLVIAANEIVALRDAFAHGRLVPLEADGLLRLMKFDRPVDDRTSVEFAVTLSLEWMHQWCLRLEREFEKVVESMRRARGRMLTP